MKLYWWAKTTAVGSGPQDTMSDSRLAAFKRKFEPKIQKSTFHPKRLVNDDKIHSLCCKILCHAEKHGDCSGAARLANSFKPSIRRTKIIKWFSTHSPVIIKVKNRQYHAHIAKEGSRSHKSFDIDAARRNPFYTLT